MIDAARGCLACIRHLGFLALGLDRVPSKLADGVERDSARWTARRTCSPVERGRTFAATVRPRGVDGPSVGLPVPRVRTPRRRPPAGTASALSAVGRTGVRRTVRSSFRRPGGVGLTVERRQADAPPARLAVGPRFVGRRPALGPTRRPTACPRNSVRLDFRTLNFSENVQNLREIARSDGVSRTGRPPDVPSAGRGVGLLVCRTALRGRPSVRLRRGLWSPRAQKLSVPGPFLRCQLSSPELRPFG